MMELTLKNIKQFIIDNGGECTLFELVTHFSVERETVLPLIDIWKKKGRIEEKALSGMCGQSTCISCPCPCAAKTMAQVYRWVNVV